MSNLPDVPGVPKTLDRSIRTVLESLREHVRELRGFGGNADQRAVTNKEYTSGGGGTTIVVPGGPGGGTTPDYTPPPSPSGGEVYAGFAFIGIETDAPSFTQGNGYGRTNVYGAKWPISDATPPTFSGAVLVHEFIGPIGSFPTDLGTRWCIWLKWVSNDGIESTDPAGGTNGFQATTGKVGTSDLGPLIVEAGNLASGAVTAGKLADGAVALTKFAAGIEPVAVVSSVPGALVTQTVFNTADDKLYRWDGAAYVKSVDGGDITAGSITAGKVAAGAINATEIAAGAIRAQHLLIAPKSLNTDPDFALGSARWSNFVDRYAAGAPGTPPGAAPGPFVARFDDRDSYSSVSYDVQGGERYLVSVWVWNNSRPDAGIFVRTGAADGTNTGNYVVGNGFATSSWIKVSAPIPIPSGAVVMSVAPWIDQPFGDTNGVWFTQLTVEKMNDASLIVDGSIIASKIAANAIAVGSAAIQDGAIRNALIENLAVDSAKIANGAIVTAKIGDAQITAAKIADANITTAKIADAQITTAKIADAQITAAKIGDAQITAAKIGDAQITAAKVSSLNVGVISTAINGGSTGDRIEMVTNKIIVYGAGVNRVKIGDLS